MGEMQRIEVNGVELAYVDRGDGPETVVFSHSFLVDHRQFEHQIETLASTTRVIAFDHRDHGASSRATDDYQLDDLVEDAHQLLDALAATPCHFVGLSTGGFIGLRLALSAPELFTTVTLMDTSAGRDHGLTRLKNKGLLQTLRILGTKPLVGQAVKAMFSDGFRRDDARAEERALWSDRIAANDSDGLVRFGRAIFSRDDVTPSLGSITTPTHVIHGEQDRALDPNLARVMADRIPNAKLTLVENAGHLCTIERPEVVTSAIADFIAAHTAG